MPDFRESNRAKLVELLKQACTDEQRLGFELEHILLHEGSLAPVAYSDQEGIRTVLERLAETYTEHIYERGQLVGLSRPGETISLEPGGQLKFAATPCSGLEEVERTYLDFRHRLIPVLEDLSLTTPLMGYHPTARAADLEIVPMERYERMVEHLGAQSPEAICMMSGTASLQLSVDYSSEQDAVRKLRLASTLAPIFALIADNAPVFEGKPRETRLARMRAWTRMKQDLVGTIPGIMDPGFSFDDYAAYILSRQAIYIHAENGSIQATGDATFEELFANREMTDDEMAHALAGVWPDARLNGCVEIRTADAMPFDFALAYTALIDRIFYDSRNIHLLDDLLEGVGEDDIAAAKESLIEHGYSGMAYGKSAAFWAEELLVLATSGPEEFQMFRFIEPMMSMIKARLTLAETWKGGTDSGVERVMDTPDISVDTGGPVIGILPHYDFETGDLFVREAVASGILAAGGLPVMLARTDSTFLTRRMLEACDGLLLVGGHDIDPNSYGKVRQLHQMRSIPGRDGREMILASSAVEAGKPVMGICRGMQVLNVALGGSLHADISATAPDTTLRHSMRPPFTRTEHEVSVEPGTLLHRIVGGDTTEVNSMHHQCVDRLGTGLRVSATAADGVVEAIESETSDTFVLGVQWHPEYLWRSREDALELFHTFVEAAAKAKSK